VDHLNSTHFFGGKSLTFKFDALFSLTIVAPSYSERIVRPLSSSFPPRISPHKKMMVHHASAIRPQINVDPSSIAIAAVIVYIIIIAVGTKQSRRRRRHHRRRLWDRE
jgi:hypothetical protein